MKAALLPDRGVIKIAGDDARRFLHGLVTSDVSNLAPGQARFAALLTPQGKIVADFIIAEAEAADGGGFFLDCPRVLAETLVQKLTLYRLRAKVIIEDLSGKLSVMAIWDGSASTEYGLTYSDPRLKALGTRCLLPENIIDDAADDIGATLVNASDYEAHRIALGVPRGGQDFIYGDAFPHDTGMDQLGGVDFKKGCYIGQEVVSRIEHRGTARTRIVSVAYDGFAPEAGTAVMAGDKTLGTLGSTADGHGVAMLRLDRVEDALASDRPVTAGGVPLRIVKPQWARFAFPGEAKAAQ